MLVIGRGSVALFLLFFLTLHISAQEHSHKHKRNEIGYSIGGVYASSHKEYGLGMHIHYMRTLKPHSKWSYGVGFEYLKLDDNHMCVEAGVSYNLFSEFNIQVLPGLIFAKELEKPVFAMHLECVYNFLYIKNIHIGVVGGYSWSKKDPHVMAGIHAAYAF